MEIDVSAIIKSAGAVIGVDYEGYITGMKDISGEYAFDSPVRLEGTVTNLAGILRLDAVLRTSYSAGCARCMKPVECGMELKINESFIKYSAGDEGEREGYGIRDATGRYFFTGNLLKPDRAVIENIILNLPLRVLCAEGCKGLCGRCGKDLNTGSCGCRPE